MTTFATEADYLKALEKAKQAREEGHDPGPVPLPEGTYKQTATRPPRRHGILR